MSMGKKIISLLVGLVYCGSSPGSLAADNELRDPFPDLDLCPAEDDEVSESSDSTLNSFFEDNATTLGAVVLGLGAIAGGSYAVTKCLSDEKNQQTNKQNIERNSRKTIQENTGNCDNDSYTRYMKTSHSYKKEYKENTDNYDNKPYEHVDKSYDYEQTCKEKLVNDIEERLGGLYNRRVMAQRVIDYYLNDVQWPITNIKVEKVVPLTNTTCPDKKIIYVKITHPWSGLATSALLSISDSGDVIMTHLDEYLPGTKYGGDGYTNQISCLNATETLNRINHAPPGRVFLDNDVLDEKIESLCPERAGAGSYIYPAYYPEFPGDCCIVVCMCYQTEYLPANTTFTCKVKINKKVNTDKTTVLNDPSDFDLVPLHLWKSFRDFEHSEHAYNKNKVNGGTPPCLDLSRLPFVDLKNLKLDDRL